MELLASAEPIVLDGELYRRGLAQISSNLEYIIDAARDADVRVFVGSQASNIRDQRPFGSAGQTPDQRADSVYDRGMALLKDGRIADARAALVRARDLDVVRFRASSDLNRLIARLAAGRGATYVPTAEAFDQAAADSVPGSDLFFEHVHPRRPGIVLLARTFFDALARDSVIGRRIRPTANRDWAAYDRRMELSAVDERLADLTVQSLAMRWPFVPPDRSADFTTTFRAVTPVDSAAFAAMIGAASWSSVKLEMAKRYAARGIVDSAVAEYRGVIRAFPRSAVPYAHAGLLLVRHDRARDALPYLTTARALGAGPEVSAALASVEATLRR
jgi:hypothetical protein